MGPIDVLSDGSADVPKRERAIIVLGKENAGIALQLAVLLAERGSACHETDWLEVKIALEADLRKIRLSGPGYAPSFEDLIQADSQAGTTVFVTGERSMLSKSIADSMSLLEGKVTYVPDRRNDNLNAQVNPYVPIGRSAAALRQSARKRK